MNWATLIVLSLPVALPSGEVLQPIDRILAESWSAAAVEPAALVDDRQFLRRLSLDLIGRIPTLAEQEEFLQRPDRPAKIQELMGRPEFARFWSEAWTAMLVGYESAFMSNREGLRLWLEDEL